MTKHPKGYEIMKEIMAKESSSADQGVASLEYNPADRRHPLLFELSRPLDDLAGMLVQTFAGRTMKEIYESHHVGRPYIKTNYRAALRQLEENGRITTTPSASERPQRKGVVTFAERVRVTFPRKS
ncbi:MAG: hypothetical protein KC731_10255 [Myxococcales bacterium]|nr:hypothetical protein [Myxococcales bacterium]